MVRRRLVVGTAKLEELGLPTVFKTKRSKQQHAAQEDDASKLEKRLEGMAQRPTTENQMFLEDLFSTKFRVDHVRAVETFDKADFKMMSEIELASLLVKREYTKKQLESVFHRRQVALNSSWP